MMAAKSTHPLDEIIQSQKSGRAAGITSICSAHPAVLEAAMLAAKESESPLLVESTCNQVNQFGGYTGMTPKDFSDYMLSLGARFGLPQKQLILGGDHLGPNVWKQEPATQAMEKSRVLVHDYVQAGFRKIHLDASMHLGGDPSEQPLPPHLIAARTAQLAQAAEQAYASLGLKENHLRYVIGTEVPPPGGIRGEGDRIHVTEIASVQETIDLTRRAFQETGLTSAWERVIAVVVHPGVEFGNDIIYPYERTRTSDLKRFIQSQSGLVFEAHSTDYQTPAALRQLVEDHFAILKVGPWLTFAYREAVYALEMIERELLDNRAAQLSNLRGTLEATMLRQPNHWQGYYSSEPRQATLQRHFSFSDRIRYYWAVEDIQTSVTRLMENLSARQIPLSLLSQYLPLQYEAIRSGRLSSQPQAIILHAVQQVLEIYWQACGLR